MVRAARVVCGVVRAARVVCGVVVPLWVLPRAPDPGSAAAGSRSAGVAAAAAGVAAAGVAAAVAAPGAAAAAAAGLTSVVVAPLALPFTLSVKYSSPAVSKTYEPNPTTENNRGVAIKFQYLSVLTLQAAILLYG